MDFTNIGQGPRKLAILAIFRLFWAGNPRISASHRKIWHGGGDRSALPNFTLIGES